MSTTTLIEAIKDDLGYLKLHRAVEVFASLADDRTQSLVGRTDPVVGLRGGSEPPFADEASFTHVVRRLGKAQAPPGRQEVASDPRGVATQDAVAGPKQLVEDLARRARPTSGHVWLNP